MIARVEHHVVVAHACRHHGLTCPNLERVGYVGALESTFTQSHLKGRRYVPQLRVLDVMLGNAPALSPDKQLYQRLLAGGSDENVRIAYDSSQNSR